MKEAMLAKPLVSRWVSGIGLCRAISEVGAGRLEGCSRGLSASAMCQFSASPVTGQL